MMVFQRTYIENKQLIKNYLAFLPEVDNPEAAVKLALEIAKLREQNKKIKNMRISDYFRYGFKKDNKLSNSEVLCTPVLI